jgi:hypothetical protein
VKELFADELFCPWKPEAANKAALLELIGFAGEL